MSLPLAGIGAATGIASSLFGGNKAAKAAKEQTKLINQQEQSNDAWYNRNYYQNYMDGSEARAAIKRVENTMQKRNEVAKATAAVTGGTQESVLAQQANDQQLMSDTVDNLAARSDARKDSVDQQNQQNKQTILNARMQQSQMNEQGGSSLMNNGFGLLGSALSLYAGNEKKKGSE